MRVITWNLGFWQHKTHHNEAWDYLRNEIKPDLALLQEVSPPKLPENEHILFRVIHEGWGTALYTRGMPLKELKFKTHPGRVAAAQVEGASGKKSCW